MVILDSKRLEDLLKFAIGLVLVVLANLLASRYFARFDLTEEGRYTIKASTKELLKELDDEVFIEVFLSGELNADLKRLQRSIAEILEEFKVYSDDKVRYTFTDPATAISPQARNEFMAGLMEKGIQPTNIIEDREGEKSEKLVYPGAIVTYAESETGVMLLKGNKMGTARKKINQSIEGLEYEFASAVVKLTSADTRRIGFLTGHGQLDSLDIISFKAGLSEYYLVEELDLTGMDEINGYDLVIAAKPTKGFSEADKFKLDQYIVRGGRTMLLLDELNVNMDSASNENNFAFPYELNLDDMLFKYGVRINKDLIQDKLSSRYPIYVGNIGNDPQIKMMNWPFFPLINQYADHPITRNLDAVVTRFISTIDTVKSQGIRKTPLMFTSAYSRNLKAPVKVSVADLRNNLNPDNLNQRHLPVAYLLEGRFTSIYKNRLLPQGISTVDFVERGQPGKILVISDGDIVRNEINPRTGQAQKLGFDPFTGNNFANEDLLLNAISYLLNDGGLITARAKEIKIRPLDQVKIANEKTKWQMINLLLPLLVLLLYGMLRYYLRVRKYSRFKTAVD